jgi:cysteine desulfurase/selenocysteine lyase
LWKSAKSATQCAVSKFQDARDQFPLLKVHVNGSQLVYLDNAATTQKPLAVLDASRRFYETINANIHRGTHYLARAATEAYELARQKIARHFGATDPAEVIFTSGCTDSINLAAHCLASRLHPGDEILISTLEHHSNIVPWQMACQRSGAVLKIIPCNECGELDQNAFQQMLSERVKIVALTWISNAFGTVNPVREMTSAAHEHGAVVMIDAAQAVPHRSVSLTDLNCDLFAFSGHKIYAPTGIGALWGKRELLENLPPYRGGGEMIKEVTFDHTTYNGLPFKFEAGTPHIAGGICLGTAFEFLESINMEAAEKHERELAKYAEDMLDTFEGLQIIGEAKDKTSVVSFSIKGIHPFDIGTLLDKQGIAVRTGHHCTQPLMDFYGIPGTVRASFAFYNTKEEIDTFVGAVERSLSMLK